MGKSDIQDSNDGWSWEYDSLPLSARLKLLRSRKQISNSVFLKDIVLHRQCESVTRHSIVDGEENGAFSSEDDFKEENMLPGQGQEHKVFLDGKILDLPWFQDSDCSLNGLSSPSSSGFCVVSDGDGGSCEGIYKTASISSSEFQCNDKSPDSDLEVSELEHATLSDIPPTSMNESDDVTLTFSLKSSMSSSSASIQGAKAEDEIPGDYDDDLEHIVLRERRQMLLSRLLVKSQRSCSEASVEMQKSHLFSREVVQQSVLTMTKDTNGEQLIAGNLHTREIGHELCCASNTPETEITGTSFTINPSSAPSSDKFLGAEYVESKSSTFSDTQEILRSKAFPSIQAKAEPFISDECGDAGKYVMENFTSSLVPVKKELGVKFSPAKTCSISVARDLNHQNKTVPSAVKLGIDRSESVKLSIPESFDTGLSSLTEHKQSDIQEKGTNSPKAVSSLPSAICVKMEPVLSNDIDNEGKTYWGKSRSPDMLPVKPEATFSTEAFEDELDHMSLLDRLVLLSTESLPSSKVSKNLRGPSKNASSVRGSRCGVTESVESISVIRPRKRRRTATNSAETALEEDIPGLLKVLIDKGVSVEEIKLYGEPESDEVIDEVFCEDSFEELEAVIQKTFSHRESLLKVTPILCSKGSKVTYCLGCLLSLVEQACYVRTQKWPVEWGWCRDLQAFIFVFQRHNRIVLERPEYGYATYFFELLDSLPVGWQIRRLVTAMKLTSCGRISVLENRPLMVGQDLSEGEARVLCQYGWVRNTGLATMLNYCGRVVHDTNKERDGNEWRLKIARMLINGYSGGSLVPKFLLEKTTENESTPSPQVKLEI